jgi:hypothetical protein
MAQRIFRDRNPAQDSEISCPPPSPIFPPQDAGMSGSLESRPHGPRPKVLCPANDPLQAPLSPSSPSHVSTTKHPNHDFYQTREGTSRANQEHAIGGKWRQPGRGFFVLTLRVPTQISYTVQTVTGDLPGAGTAAAVFITLHGSKGDSRRIQLSNSEFLSSGSR